jgi:hypothetical protein
VLTLDKLREWLLAEMPADVDVARESHDNVRKKYLCEVLGLRSENEELRRKLEESDKKAQTKLVLETPSPSPSETQVPDFDGMERRLRTTSGLLRTTRRESSALTTSTSISHRPLPLPPYPSQSHS